MAKTIIKQEKELQIENEVIETKEVKEVEILKDNKDIVKAIKALVSLTKEVGDNMRKSGKANRRHVALANKLNAYVTRKVFC